MRVAPSSPHPVALRRPSFLFSFWLRVVDAWVYWPRGADWPFPAVLRIVGRKSQSRVRRTQHAVLSIYGIRSSLFCFVFTVYFVLFTIYFELLSSRPFYDAWVTFPSLARALFLAGLDSLFLQRTYFSSVHQCTFPVCAAS